MLPQTGRGTLDILIHLTLLFVVKAFAETMEVMSYNKKLL